MMIDETKIYVRYAEDIIDGKIIAGKYIILACKRFIEWFNRADI